MLVSALIGNPVDHSVSPQMFNYIARKTHVEYTHLKINVIEREKLNESLDSMSKLGFIGANVTIPYKIDVIPYMDILTPSALDARSVNTIKFCKNKYIGYNTDGIAAIRTIEKKLTSIYSDTRVLIIGAGGTARAVLSEVYKRSKNIRVINRDPKEASDMICVYSKTLPVVLPSAENFKTQISEADLVINTTPVGMFPNKRERLYHGNILDEIPNLGDKCFFDAIFNPYKTNFLIDSENHGAKICSGLYMMIMQILLAFSIWTDIDVGADIDLEDAKDFLLHTAYDHFKEKKCV